MPKNERTFFIYSGILSAGRIKWLILIITTQPNKLKINIDTKKGKRPNSRPLSCRADPNKI